VSDSILSTFSDLIRYFDPDLIIALWSRTFTEYGPHHSQVIRDEGAIHWVSESIKRAGTDHKSAPEIAACGLHRLVTGHAFVDCNHRTGWLVCQTLMELAGYDLVKPTPEVVDFVKSIDRENKSEEEVASWVGKSFLRLR
jgi:death-on-curing family protein